MQHALALGVEHAVRRRARQLPGFPSPTVNRAPPTGESSCWSWLVGGVLAVTGCADGTGRWYLPAEQRQRVQLHSRGSVRERALDRDANQVVTDSSEPFLRERRAKGIADQRLATDWIVAGGGVQGEAPIAHQERSGDADLSALVEDHRRALSQLRSRGRGAGYGCGCQVQEALPP
ncbi:MAG: hypothetical protein JW751_01165 [Polyangiaceae bacterium]|nr:hypothetical protein [Polyangiaceae bacterium]